MKKENFKYYQNLIRLWLFKAVLVFSVFSFTGFNLHINAAAIFAVKTELAETRNRKPAFELNNYSKILLAKSLSGKRTFNSWTVLNQNTLIKSQYKSYRSRNLLYCISSIDIHTKIPPSSTEDEALHAIS